MNSYISIFNKEFMPIKWIKTSIITLVMLSASIFTINYVVDPYSITKYNLLGVEYKLARDDREFKVNHFKNINDVDNILIGSSRVYSINPLTVEKLIGGKTYNFGVGTATVEDHLGIIKYLERNKKLPKKLIVGLDFYTFNKDHPLNKYFLRNQDLNFLSYKDVNESYIDKFFSVDSTIATFKTLKNHFRKKIEKPRFDENGWGGYKRGYLDYSKIDLNKENLKTKKEINNIEERYYSDYKYNKLDKKRLEYYKEIEKIAKDNNVELILFTTPLHPSLLKKLRSNNNTNKAMKDFLDFFSKYDNFINLYDDKEIYSDLKNFNGATHTTTNAGDIVLKRVLSK